MSGNGRRHLTVNTVLLEQNHLRIEEPRPDLVNQSLVASCGRPLSGIDVRIVDAATSVPLGEGGIGEVWIAGGSKALGYWNNAAITRRLFEASLDGPPGAGDHLRTGDVGFFHEGELFICGRLKDLVIVGGRNCYPADIEAVIERASPKVRLGCVAAFGVDRQDQGEGIVVLPRLSAPTIFPISMARARSPKAVPRRARRARARPSRDDHQDVLGQDRAAGLPPGMGIRSSRRHSVPRAGAPQCRGLTAR